MEVNLRPKNFKLSADIEQHIRSRLERLVRPLDSAQSAEVVLTQQPTHTNPQRVHYRAQLTIDTGNSRLIRSEVENAEVLTAIDQAVDHLSRQIERYKTRHERKRRGAHGLGKAVADEVGASDAVEEVEPENGRQSGKQSSNGKIVRVKSFSFAPMFPEDAAEQMELLGHSFFVFWNATEERVNVLYKRNDGNYGLIQPDFS